LRAGLYIGASDDEPTAAMSATSVITDKAALHKGPACPRRELRPFGAVRL
jgi:hypothetical protein